MTPKKLRAAIIALQDQLVSSQQGLAAGQAEALHSMRVTLRQLCSLLKPLARLPAFSGLYASARALARQSNPLRDEEVLCAELARIAPALAERRQQALAAAYVELCGSPALDACRQVLAEFLANTTLPDKATLRTTLGSAIGHWQRQLQRALEKQDLLEAAAAGAIDLGAVELNRHRLRLLIKRLRYTLVLWQKSSPRHRRLVNALRQSQDSLGDWHDRLVWLARSQQDAELLPFATAWASEMQAHAAWSDYQLTRLEKPLRQWRKRQEKK